MKILFIKKGDSKLGSNRIYIDNISHWIKSNFDEVNISDKVLKGYDIYIISKYTKIDEINQIKNLSPNCKIGLIHPNDNNKKNLIKILNCDFLIVGSIEEYDYYLKYTNKIIRFPQIENLNCITKKHFNKKIITIGYHGNLEHLNEMNASVKNAVEKLYKKYDIKLKVIYDQNLGNWKVGRPKIPIKEVQWKLDSLVHEMEEIDIGIVPCTNNYFLDKHHIELSFISKLFKKLTSLNNGRINDYILRFKANSNAGRCYVFHQLFIPVIADFWPCNFELLDNETTGYLAHNEYGWYNAIEKLINSAELRNKFSFNAQKVFLEKYNTKKHVNELILFLKNKI